MTTTMNLLTWARETGTTVDALAERHDGRIMQYSTDSEPQGREGLSYDEAVRVAAEDPSLLYVELTDVEMATEREAQARASADVTGEV